MVTEKIHVFEKAGLGKAPFRFVGAERCVVSFPCGGQIVTRSGGTCDYCSTAISDKFHILSADGREFHVGCDCVLKTGDEGLIRKVSESKKKLEQQKRADRATMIKDYVIAKLQETPVRNALLSQPHPNPYYAGNGKTALDYANWMLENAGNSGISQIKRLILSV